jgi:hypothetical protein
MTKSVRNSCHLDQTYSVPFIIAPFNRANRGIIPSPKDRGSEKLASAPPSEPGKYDSIKEGELIRVKPKKPRVSHHHVLHDIANLISCL